MNFQTFIDPHTLLSMSFVWQNFRSLIYLFADLNNNVLFFPWFTLAWPIYFQTSIIAPFQGCIRLNLNKAISVSSRKTMTMQFLRITTFSIWSQLDSFQWEWLACWTVRNTYNFALSKTMPCLFHFFEIKINQNEIYICFM